MRCSQWCAATPARMPCLCSTALYVVASAEAVDRVIEQTPGDARFFAGFVGWQPGDLEKEIDAGYWHVMNPDSALFFRPDTTRLWEELIERLRFRSASL